VASGGGIWGGEGGREGIATGSGVVREGWGGSGTRG
jgi:hypothetical protein